MKIENMVFLDIETVSVTKTLEDCHESLRKNFNEYCERRFLKDDPTLYVNELFEAKAALIPEYSEIACISIGKIINGEYKISTLVNEENNSKTILEKLAKYFHKLPKETWLCGFNINSFDLPFLMKHMIKNEIEIPNILNLFDVKPWERKVFDIFDFWKGTRSDYLSSLSMVCEFLGIENPKESFKGSEVSKYFWGSEEEFPNAKLKIKEYCEGDVFACMKIFEKLKKCGCF